MILPVLPIRPVIVEISTIGRRRGVRSVREAAELLVGDWPAEKRDTAWRNACEAAHAALAGTGSDAASARTAFIRAAKEARIFVREGDGRR
jgi:hypothetical protein